MNALPDHTQTVTRHRTRIERRIVRLLEKTGSDATLDEIKAVIWNEDAERPFLVYLTYITELFPDEDGRHSDAIIPTIQDAWNYFPHKRLDGLCPAELMLEQVPGLTPRDLRA